MPEFRPAMSAAFDGFWELGQRALRYAFASISQWFRCDCIHKLIPTFDLR